MATTGYKNPTSVTTTGVYTTIPNTFLVDLDNIGAADATITNEDGTTWILKAGASKSIATGTPMDSFQIDATGTTVQIIYTR